MPIPKITSGIRNLLTRRRAPGRVGSCARAAVSAMDRRARAKLQRALLLSRPAQVSRKIVALAAAADPLATPLRQPSLTCLGTFRASRGLVHGASLPSSRAGLDPDTRRTPDLGGVRAPTWPRQPRSRRNQERRVGDHLAVRRSRRPTPFHRRPATCSSTNSVRPRVVNKSVALANRLLRERGIPEMSLHAAHVRRTDISLLLAAGCDAAYVNGAGGAHRSDADAADLPAADPAASPRGVPAAGKRAAWRVPRRDWFGSPRVVVPGEPDKPASAPAAVPVQVLAALGAVSPRVRRFRAYRQSSSSRSVYIRSSP